MVANIGSKNDRALISETDPLTTHFTLIECSSHALRHTITCCLLRIGERWKRAHKLSHYLICFANANTTTFPPPFPRLSRCTVSPLRSCLCSGHRSHVDALSRYDRPYYHGRESAAVPQPVCLMVYIVVMLTAAYEETQSVD